MSLGASGALMACVGVYGTLIPDSRLSLIFLPMYSFTAQDGIKGLIAFDLLCMAVQVTLKKGFLDNASHLGGMLFGIWWITEGHKLVKPVVKTWVNDIRPLVMDR